jgi:predicted ATP-dependent endonuclease of OLD family
MYIKSIVLKRFKRFHELRIELPPGVKLVILAGPNGTGKSSLFDAFQVWHKANGGLGLNWDLSYYPKAGDVSAPTHNWNESIRIEFHDSVSQDQRDRRKAFSFRSAYRNDRLRHGLKRRDDRIARHALVIGHGSQN